MTLFQAIILGIIQGITEFAPISSSAHLVLVPHLFKWPNHSLSFDVILHLGTLVAVVSFFWRDIVSLSRRLAFLIVIGTIPAALIGFLFKDFFENLFHEPSAVAILLLVTGLILFLSEKYSHWRNLVVKKQEKSLEKLNLIDSILIGFAQALAIAPGISRSGSTIAAGLSRGFSREAAARFSFLLAIPIILGAAAEEARGLANFWDASGIILVSGFLAAALSGYLCIKYLLAYLRRGRLNVFAYYCWIVGIGFILWEIIG